MILNNKPMKKDIKLIMRISHIQSKIENLYLDKMSAKSMYKNHNLIILHLEKMIENLEFNFI